MWFPPTKNPPPNCRSIHPTPERSDERECIKLRHNVSVFCVAIGASCKKTRRGLRSWGLVDSSARRFGRSYRNATAGAALPQGSLRGGRPVFSHMNTRWSRAAIDPARRGSHTREQRRIGRGRGRDRRERQDRGDLSWIKSARQLALRVGARARWYAGVNGRRRSLNNTFNCRGACDQRGFIHNSRDNRLQEPVDARRVPGNAREDPTSGGARQRGQSGGTAVPLRLLLAQHLRLRPLDRARRTRGRGCQPSTCLPS